MDSSAGCRWPIARASWTRTSGLLNCLCSVVVGRQQGLERYGRGGTRAESYCRSRGPRGREARHWSSCAKSKRSSPSHPSGEPPPVIVPDLIGSGYAGNTADSNQKSPLYVWVAQDRQRHWPLGAFSIPPVDLTRSAGKVPGSGASVSFLISYRKWVFWSRPWNA